MKLLRDICLEKISFQIKSKAGQPAPPEIVYRCWWDRLQKEQNVRHARNLFIPIRATRRNCHLSEMRELSRWASGQFHLRLPRLSERVQHSPDGRWRFNPILERSNNGKPTIQFCGRLGSSKPADYGSRRCDRNHRDETWAEGEMMSNYRESYIYQLKKENQVLWGELSEMVRNSPEWKAVRKAIEANDTEISVMQDIIKRAKEQNEQVRINSELISSLI